MTRYIPFTIITANLSSLVRSPNSIDNDVSIDIINSTDSIIVL